MENVSRETFSVSNTLREVFCKMNYA